MSCITALNKKASENAQQLKVPLEERKYCNSVGKQYFVIKKVR